MRNKIDKSKCLFGLKELYVPPVVDWIFLAIVVVLTIIAIGGDVFAAGRLPGADASDKLEAAGTLLRIVDTALFVWGARIFCGISVLGAGWALKEQKFGTAVIAVVAAIVIGTAPMWVANIFDIGGGQGVFSSLSNLIESAYA